MCIRSKPTRYYRLTLFKLITSLTELLYLVKRYVHVPVTGITNWKPSKSRPTGLHSLLPFNRGRSWTFLEAAAAAIPPSYQTLL